MSNTVMERARNKTVGLGLATLLAAASTSAFSADTETTITSSIEKMYPGVRVTSVSETRVRGMYEVISGTGEIIYSDATGQTLFFGQMIDAPTRTNLTEEKMSALNAIKFDDLPLEHAIKTVKGDGSRVMAAFEDPNCGFCKKLHEGLKSLTNYTMYTFLLPMLGEDSRVKTTNIWCADKKEEVMTAWMAQGIRPANATKCDTPTAKVEETARRLRVNGTPAIFFADGTRNPGYLAPDKLDRRLTESTLAAARQSAKAGNGTKSKERAPM